MPFSSHSRFTSLARVFAHHREALRRRIRNRMGRHIRRMADSEDIVDSAFRQGLERCRKPDAPKKWLGWLWKAAMNRLRDLGRRASLERRCEEGDSMVFPGDLAAPVSSPHSRARRSEERDRLDRALARLRPKDQAALRHYYSLGLRGEALGRSLGGISASAAAHRVRRAWERWMRLGESLE